MLRNIFFIVLLFLLNAGNIDAQYRTISYENVPKDTVAKKDFSNKFKNLSPGKVALMSTLVPGAGQVYNGQWYKTVVLYAGIAVIAYSINFNEQEYVQFKQAYKARTDNNPLSIDKYDTASHSGQPFVPDAQTLLDYREYYHRNRDLLYILGAVVYTANIIDAYVYAHLKSFDISDKLSMQVNPLKISNIANGMAFTPSVKFKF